MQEFRNEKIKNRIRELSAIFIERQASPTSLITVTGVTLSPDNKYAKILISVLPVEKENAAYGFIKRNLGDMRRYVQENLSIHPTPYLDVAIDEGEKSRQKIDELLKNG